MLCMSRGRREILISSAAGSECVQKQQQYHVQDTRANCEVMIRFNVSVDEVSSGILQMSYNGL